MTVQKINYGSINKKASLSPPPLVPSSSLTLIGARLLVELHSLQAVPKILNDVSLAEPMPHRIHQADITLIQY